MIDQSKKYDVFGIGNAMVDFLIEVENVVLDELKLPKGQFTGISEEEMKIIYDRIELKKFQRVPGGSTANIITGIAQMGGKAIFCGEVGQGDNGRYYEEKFLEAGVIPRLRKSINLTGRAHTFITPDKERTFASFQGACLDIVTQNILDDDIKNSKIVHIEGYQLQSSSIRDFALETLKAAKKYNIPISVDLNDAYLISKNLDFTKDIVRKYIDIVFANEMEAESFTGESDPLKALNILADYCSIAIVKNGASGSYIKYEDKVYEIAPFVTEAVDTTGAGDMYAAGFLYGLTKGYDMKISGSIGSFAASKVVSQIGARYDGDIRAEIEGKIFR